MTPTNSAPGRPSTSEVQRPGPQPGARPANARDERDAAQRVREMFSQIAPRYDFLNHFLSLSLDRVWRRRSASRFSAILSHSDARALDLCCGTGDLAFALERQSRRSAPPNSSGARVYGADFALPMLVRAHAKRAQANLRSSFLASDALSLPFEAGRFDLVTAAFGFRNLANYDDGLREIFRVLRPGGEAGILEFCEPQKGIGAGLFRFYFRRVLPALGGAISGNPDAYAYLPGSISKFPAPSELSEWMKRAGFSNVRYEVWNFGSVALHRATK
jgi:demethylmenaquinone methyltransferase / 2-methoxy-6-polyprenyl-1,4-benzoquinol methylase